VCSFYSCSEPELNNPFSDGGEIPPDVTITDSALRFYPLYKEVSTSSQFTMDIYVDIDSEDVPVPSLIGAEIEFTYDKSLVSFDMAEKGAKLSSLDDILIQEDDTETGSVRITLATALDDGAGITGSGSLVQVSFTPLTSGSFELDLSASSLFIKNYTPNSSTSFSSLINATIVIE